MREAARRREAKGTGLKIGDDHATAALLSCLIACRGFERVADVGLREELRSMTCGVGWSPDAALGWLRRTGLLGTDISTPTLYSYIANGVLDIDVEDLPRRGAQRRRRRREYARLYRRSYRKVGCTSIEERPEAVGDREEFGHWEGDLIVGRSGTRTVVMTLTERKTRYELTCMFADKRKGNAPAFLDRLEKSYGTELFRETFKSITFDNGSEFLDYDAIERSRFKKAEGRPRTKAYYAHPFRSCERGSNENANGLLRRGGIRKGANIGLLGEGVVKNATEWINNLPRRILGYMTAEEAFSMEFNKLKHNM
jgi:IS30 family transposase